MRLDLATWQEVVKYLQERKGIILPVGSTEQHGPMGLIGTDAICAQAIAERAGDIVGAYVAPTVAYTPAPFNTSFPGTISLSTRVFSETIGEICAGLRAQGFERLYLLNAHGANIEPMKEAIGGQTDVLIRSWWEFDEVNVLRATHFGDWEGLHATPSEISITQTLHRQVAPGEAAVPPRKLTPDEVRRRAGDRHGPPELHREEFPDGRVGSHSALATPDFGRELLSIAGDCVARDYLEFVGDGA